MAIVLRRAVVLVEAVSTRVPRVGERSIEAMVVATPRIDVAVRSRG